MSEYFRKYIKKEHYPNPPYSHNNQVKTSSSKLLLEIVSTRPLIIVSGSNRMAMTGIWCGVKNSKLTGYFRNTGSLKVARSITSEDGENFAKKIYWAKILRNSRERLISRGIVVSQVSTIFCLLLFCCQVNTSFFMSNSSGINIMTKSFGLWSLY